MKVAVIGGGIAGLSTAYYLNKKALESGKDIKLVLIESENYWGGKIKTKVEDGFVVEGGPDAYLAMKPWLKSIINDLELTDDLQGTNPNNSSTFILHRGKLTGIPTGLTMTIPTEFGPMITTKLMSWSQKIRMGFDLFIPRSKRIEDESLAGFISRRLGRAAYEKLIGPLLSGIYAGDGDKLSLASTFPNLREMENDHGGLIMGALNLKKKRRMMAKERSKDIKSVGKPKSRSIFESPKSGLVSVVDAIIKNLKKSNASLMLNTQVDNIVQIENGFELALSGDKVIQVDAVVLATPAYISGKLLKDINQDLATDLGKIDYATTATVSFAFLKKDLPDNLDGYGYIIPQEEDSKALACTWTSSKWDYRAPDEFALLRVFIGRIQDTESLPTEKSALIAMAREELLKTMKISIEPEKSWVFRWEKAMPQYNLGHPERLKRIDNQLSGISNIALAGNGFKGIGMPDCVRSGMEAATKILAN
jgi:protoporphyrinogen/coproporphyrinogen III oxidase